MAAAGRVERLHRILDRDPAIDADQHQHVRGQVQAEHLAQLEQLAEQVARDPVHRVVTGGLPDQAEPRHQHVRDREVKDERVDGAPVVARDAPRLAVLLDVPHGGDVAEQRHDRHRRQDDHPDHARLGQGRGMLVAAQARYLQRGTVLERVADVQPVALFPREYRIARLGHDVADERYQPAGQLMDARVQQQIGEAFVLAGAYVGKGCARRLWLVLYLLVVLMGRMVQLLLLLLQLDDIRKTQSEREGSVAGNGRSRIIPVLQCLIVWSFELQQRTDGDFLRCRQVQHLVPYTCRSLLNDDQDDDVKLFGFAGSRVFKSVNSTACR
uniref:Uncharacterized protein n=1 Tax=Anopheles coluzzii TaxID=1518534 RepID=A0A8W7PN22_ANOCL